MVRRTAAVRTTAGLCAAVTLLFPGPTARAARAADVADAPSYAFASDARTVPGATGTTDAVPLAPGTTYRSALTDGGKTYYRLDLDAESTTYVSVTAIPRPDATLAVTDGIRVSVQDADGNGCSRDTSTVGVRSPRPVTSWGAREIVPDRSLCQDAGAYYVVVERAGSTAAEGSASQPWELELTPVAEPPLEHTGATKAPEAWDSATPAPPTGTVRRRPGGAGFATAAPLGQGTWGDEIVPGQTLFYEVPLGWGQQPYATVELGSSGTDSGYVAAALDLTLHNPVRAEVEYARTGYGGTQKSASLRPVPPVAYANRYAPTDAADGMRFAGSYYLVVHLSAQVAERFGDGPYGLTLRVRITGTAETGPEYAGESVPQGIFGAVGHGGGGPAATGDSDDSAMTALAVGGFGAGSALLLVLGLWTVAARRRAAT